MITLISWLKKLPNVSRNTEIFCSVAFPSKSRIPYSYFITTYDRETKKTQTSTACKLRESRHTVEAPL
ncbi:hypothetical protein BDU57DRAFT_548889 [Ampelomyces quisqualis]|uniref:Uncharacterized protein n=1 Tax=Ampelomyces quisqualis TaxID=50730 RepID=A0A6A5QHZ6_AMPQU|nr:hypothetical protein BDU57DRAFT_548889 [Ampelomyces quisqualis]